MAKPLSPEAVQAQSRQNLSRMAQIVDGLYQRASTPETREAIMTMNNALQSIHGTGRASVAVLDVEKLLHKVLSDYNQDLDGGRTERTDVATIDIINQIVNTRKKMSVCTVDTDKKRGLKYYLKANKGRFKKSELKQMYEEEYERGMEEVSKYVNSAKILEQLVKSYQVTVICNKREAAMADLDAEIKELAKKYKAATDQTTRDRLNKEYQALLDKKKSLNVELLQAQNARNNIAKVESLLQQIQTQTALGAIDNVDIKEVENLAQSVAKGIKKSQARATQIADAYGAADTAMDSMLNRASETANRGASLDDVLLQEQSASLDDIAGSASVGGAVNDMPSLDDISID